MSDIEQGSSQGKPEFKLILPSLPTLYDGVFEDVYADYIEDPERFLVSLAHRMENETNSSVLRFIDNTYPSHASNEISLKWPGIYYEMFSRSARRTGLPLIHITDKLVDEYFHAKAFKMKVLDSDGTDGEFFAQEDKEWKRRRAIDEAAICAYL